MGIQRTIIIAVIALVAVAIGNRVPMIRGLLTG